MPEAEAQVKVATYEEAEEAGFLSIFEIARDYTLHCSDGDYSRINPFPGSINDSQFSNNLRRFWEGGVESGIALRKIRKENEALKQEEDDERAKEELSIKKAIEAKDAQWRDGCVRAGFIFLMNILSKDRQLGPMEVFGVVKQAEGLFNQINESVEQAMVKPVNPAPDPEYVD